MHLLLVSQSQYTPEKSQSDEHAPKFDGIYQEEEGVSHGYVYICSLSLWP